MGWTAPRTWVVSEIVTAAMMNAHVRDNLDYLKGNAGTVAIADNIAPLGVAALRNDGSYQFTCERTTAVARKYGFAVSGSDGSFGLDDVTAGARRFTVGMTGNIGMGGVTNPQGPMHATGAGGGWLYLSAAAVVGTLVTLAIAGTVTVGMIVWLCDRNNGAGAFTSGFNGQVFSLTSALTYVNTDTLTLTLTAGGAITIQRTTGTNGSHDVNMAIMYR